MSSLESISKYGVKKSYKKDDIVCMQGDTGSHMYIALSGNFTVYINSLTDFPIKVSEITPGQFFGEMSVLDDAPRSATIISENDSLVLSISKDDFKRLIMQDGEIALSIMRTLSKRIRILNEDLEKTRHSYVTADFSDTYISDTGVKHGKIEILPKGHKTYGIIRPKKYEFFTADKQIECPVCSHSSRTKIPLFSKLAQKDAHIEKDLRLKYDNFDPLWYGVIVCPNCNYANYYMSFSRIGSEAVNALKSSMYKERVEKFTGKAMNTIDAVIEAYYLVLLCNLMGEKSPETDAKTWLRLYWLYSDADDSEQKLEAAEKALSGYEKIVHGMNDDEMMQAYTIMAELAFALGDFRKAMVYYEQVCKNTKKNNIVMFKQAHFRLGEIKSIAEENCV